MRLPWFKAAPALLCLSFAAATETAPTRGTVPAPTVVATTVAPAPAAAAAPCDSQAPSLKVRRDIVTATAGVPKGADPFLAAMLGALPLMSGFYLTSAPQKGIAFTLADILLLGAIAQVHNNEQASRREASVYYWSMGAVNIADMVLSVWQIKSDNARRLNVFLNPPTSPGLTVAWHF